MVLSILLGMAALRPKSGLESELAIREVLEIFQENLDEDVQTTALECLWGGGWSIGQ